MTAEGSTMSDRLPDPHAGLPEITGHQDTLDGVRAVAAFAVLVFHVGLNAGTSRAAVPGAWLLNGGEGGVALFFLLSGLLLYRPWARAVLEGRTPPRVRAYLRRRALRLLPAYWALVACVMLLAQRRHLGDGWAWAQLLTLTHIYVPRAWWGSGLGPREMGQAWSLAVEAAWYLTLPATAAALAWCSRGPFRGGPAAGGTVDVAGRARRLLWAMCLYGLLSLGYTATAFIAGPHPIALSWPPRYLAWFATGMALAVVTVWARAEPLGTAARICRTVGRSWGVCWLAALFLYVMAASPLTGARDLATLDTVWTAQLHTVLYGLCAAFFVAPVALAPAGHPAITAVLGNRVMRFLGRISYGVFLWQMIIILGWYDATGRLFHGDLLIDLPVLAVASVAAATLSYYLLERPVQRLAGHRARSGRSPGLRHR
ncbi:MAG: cyclic nucleotide-binding protein [Streptosporangiaceae bacterium]|nr:cyclic nucleotide-binding protein [Streptosporangiaceae bacterium]